MLTDTKIKNAKPRDKVYRLSDQQGLCLEVRPTGAKFWRYRFRFDDKAKMMTLGEYPMMALSQARTVHQQARELLKKGVNPISQEKENKKNVREKRELHFSIFANEYLEKIKSTKSVGYYSSANSQFNNYILPVIGSKSIYDIDTIDILDLMDNILKSVRKNNRNGTGEVTAELCRQHISRIFRIAMRRYKGVYDPTIPAKGEIERPPINHARDLSRQELQDLLKKLDEYNGFPSTKGVLWTMIYTMCRTKEARFMQWEHIDFEEKIWKIPLAEISRRKKGERNIKTDIPHIFPLSEPMILLLQEMKKISGNMVYVFPSPKKPNQPIGATTINRALEYMRMDDVTGHDVRSTCSTYLHGMGFDTQHINVQMAHIDNSISGIYNHARWLPERTKMMNTWADFIQEIKKSLDF